MKTFRVTFDEALLRRLDRHPSVRYRGRSTVLREAVAEYLTREDADDTEQVARRYRAGYRDTSTLDDELEGWAVETHRTNHSLQGPDEEHRE